MFHISQTKSQSRTTVVVDGPLVGDYTGVAEMCCQQASSCGQSVDVLFRDLSDIDPAGLDLLGRLVASGVHVQVTGIYTSYIMEKLRHIVSIATRPPLS